MRKLVRRADDECIERVARIQLVVRGFEIEFGLGGSRRTLHDRLLFRANKVEHEVRLADFNQDSFQKLAVGLRQPFAEELRGDPDDQAVVFGTLLPRRPEPSRETMWIDSTFRVLKDLVPKIHRKTIP